MRNVNMQLMRSLAIVFTIVGVAGSVVGELPDESVLPGDRPDVVVPNPPSDLPSEAILPGELKAEDPRVDDPPANRDLPGESLLPDDVAIQVDDPPTTIDDLMDDNNDDAQQPPADAIGARPQGQPWLRFNLPGHSAPIRALTYVPGSNLLASAGEDKIVQLWSPRPDGSGYMPARTIRWQVQRGARGRIYALAASEDSLALAGHGAMGMLGEIILVDPATGQFERALTNEKGHRQVIASLSFSPSGNRLAALDVAGQSSLWTRNPATGQWTFTNLTSPDTERFGAANASKLTASRRTAPVIVAGERVVVQPVFQEFKTFQGQSQEHAIWHLESIDLATGRSSDLTAAQPHYGMVTALAVSPDGRLVASADAFGQLFLWDLASGKAVYRGQLEAVAVSLAFDPTSKRLLAGSARSPRIQNKAQVQIYNVTNPAQPTVVHTKRLPSDIYAAVTQSGGNQFAYSQGTEVHIATWNQPAAETTLEAASVRPIHRVAFARERPFYRIAIGTTVDENGERPLEMSYDLGMLQLGRDAKIDKNDWLSGSTWKRQFSIKPVDADNYQVLDGEALLCTINLRAEFHGSISAAAWIPDRTGKAAAVAVGTSTRGDIYVYRITNDGQPAPLLRHFRGHGGRVTSLCISRDLKYLVSGSYDATARIWPMIGFDSDDPTINRWGATLAVEDGVATVSDIRADGPLYHRGMRQGDTIAAIAWHDGTKVTKLEDAGPIIAALEKMDTDQLVMFEYRRGRMAQEAFQIFPAWNQLSSLAISNDREWAYWTPAGYYDASFDGHKMFGWQINRGLDNPPEFFLAAQFREALEKPEVMERLLEAGSLEEALKLAQEPPAVEASQAVIAQVRSAPRIEILEPKNGVAIGGGRTRVKAAISVRRGIQLARVKAFANGVVAGEGQVIEQEAIPGGTKFVYEFEASLPSEPAVAIDVIAATDADTADFARVTVDQDVVAGPAKGRMFVFSVGINEYADAQIPPLDFAVNNASKVAQVLKTRGEDLYDAEAVTLSNASVTRSMWRVVAEEYADSLRERVTADDLLVLFLSGHGLRDEATGNYYYVSADANYTDIKNQQFGSCLSADDLAVFADIPCRKLVILDTCHSGAVNNDLRNPELKQRDLKAAVRALQSDMMLTITASEGHEEAFEQKDREHGLFTARLIEALGGAADRPDFGGDADGRVTLPETIHYVRNMVETDSATEGLTQHPTAGPADLLPLVRLPLTTAQGE